VTLGGGIRILYGCLADWLFAAKILLFSQISYHFFSLICGSKLLGNSLFIFIFILDNLKQLQKYNFF
jgi:hypothetical protein